MQQSLSQQANSPQKIALLSFLASLSILFPEVGIFPSDVQPNFIVIAIVYILFVSTNITFNANILAFTFSSLTCIYLSFLINSGELTNLTIVKYTAAIISPLLCYVLVANRLLIIRGKLILFSTFIYSAIAFVQFFVPDFLSFLVYSPISTEGLSASGRGMPSITAEPSHFGKVILILNLLYVFDNIKMLAEGSLNLKTFRKKSAVPTLFFFTIAVALSGSAYVLILYLLFIFFLLNMLQYKIFNLLSYSVILMFLVFILYKNFSDLRIFNMVSYLFSSPERLTEQGAFLRLINIPASIISMFDFGMFGVGDSSRIYHRTFDLWIFGQYSYSYGNRLYGGAIEYLVKFGILSIPIFLGYFYVLLRISKLKIVIAHTRPYFVGHFLAFSLLLISLQDGSPASPLVIYAFISVFVYIKYLNHEKF